MPARRRSLWTLLLALGVLVLAGCEPYLSMTDQIPVQTRRAATLLPENPRYVGMVEVDAAVRHLGELRGENLGDSLRQTTNPYLRSFLDATGMKFEEDVQAAYGAFGKGDTFSAVLFANLMPEQMDRYLEQAPAGAGRRTSYRGVPLYHLALGTDASASDTLSIAFVGKGMIAAATHAARVTAMVDRHAAEKKGGLGANEAYMTLVKRVGHGSTAWLVGRDVVEAALQDSADTGEHTAESASRVSRAGLQHALTQWTDRVLGLSKVSSFDGPAGDRVNRLKQRLREQAISITLTDTALQGEVYLTMRDDASAASVVDVAEGAVAVMKLSRDELEERHRDLLDEIEIDRRGSIVHIHFSLDRTRLRDKVAGEHRTTAVRRDDPSIRRFPVPVRRSSSITSVSTALHRAQSSDATYARMALSIRPGPAETAL